jgi:hypothetical protein
VRNSSGTALAFLAETDSPLERGGFDLQARDETSPVIVALPTLPPHILTQGTAIRSVIRNLGGSISVQRSALAAAAS